MPSVPRPASRRREDGSDPAGDDAIPLDEAGEDAIPPTEPPVDTALDDDEGGADPIDPDTGLPYDETDPGTEAPPAERRGGTPEA
jgi:hypothetical protein